MNVAVICYINKYIKLNSSATQLNSTQGLLSQQMLHLHAKA